MDNSDISPTPLELRMSTFIKANSVDVADNSEKEALTEIARHITSRMPYDIMLEKNNYSKVTTYTHWKKEVDCNLF